MIFVKLNNHLKALFKINWKQLCLSSLICLLLITGNLIGWMSPAIASINDDKYEGNIFVLFAGNGSIVPPRFDLAESLQRKKPALLVYYLDDSRDCKEFSIVVTRLHDFYGRAASFIPISVDSLPIESRPTPQEPAYYYEGVVPQTVLLDADGKVVFNGKGQVKFEEVDDVFREIFDLLPRSESVELKRRSFNEFNSELVN
jgi:hypothetical protein